MLLDFSSEEDIDMNSQGHIRTHTDTLTLHLSPTLTFTLTLTRTLSLSLTVSPSYSLTLSMSTSMYTSPLHRAPCSAFSLRVSRVPRRSFLATVESRFVHMTLDSTPWHPVDLSLEHARVQKCASHVFRIEADPVNVRPRFLQDSS